MSLEGSLLLLGWLIGLILLFLLSRILFVITYTVKKCRSREKRLGNEKIKTLIVIGSGGHTTEMMNLIQSLDPARYSPRLYVMASSDVLSEHKIVEYENYLKCKGINSKHVVIKIPRSRNVHQSFFTSVFTTLYSSMVTVPVMLRFRPDLILSNGPGTCVPVCVIGFLMRCFFISNNTIIFVESICRVNSMSLTGKILQWIADDIYVQWPELLSKCKRAIYIGRIV